MENKEHIIIFSHGFGVKKDDRGLLTDIANAFPGAITYLFDYFIFDSEKSTLTMRPLSEQVQIFQTIFKEAKSKYPDAIIDVVAHSQGTLIPCLAKLEGIRKTILLTPVFDMSIERTIKRYSPHPESEINLDGMSKLPKLDGYTRLIPKEYWTERAALRKPADIYNEFAQMTELTIFNANQDAILGSADISDLGENITVIALDGNHDFSGEPRKVLLEKLKETLA